MRKAVMSAGLAMTLLACSMASLPFVPPAETPTRSPVKGARLTKTAKAALSEAAAASTATLSPFPSSTPTPSPAVFLTPTLPFSLPSSTPTPSAAVSLTPTLPFVVVSSTAVPTLAPPTAALNGSPTAPSATPSALACQLVWQSPGNGIVYDPQVKFTTGWNIKNTGTQTWEAGTMQFTYLGGAKLHSTDIFPLPSSVGPGQTIVLSVPMKAPQNSTKYTTYWGLRQGDIFFCRVHVSIYVDVPSE